MKTQMKKVGDTVVISMNGKLNYEVQEPLKEDLHQLADRAKHDSVPRKIIIDFENLEFVGSSGISTFIQTLKDFNQDAPVKPRFCNVSSEFRRIMNALDDSGMFEIHDNVERARKSFDQ